MRSALVFSVEAGVDPFITKSVESLESLESLGSHESVSMSIIAPYFLVALALLVPVLIAFLVRRQRHVLRVPSTMVWRLGAQSVAKSRRIRDIRRLIALLACLTGVAALVVAAARPSGQRGDTHVFVVDVSASMAGAPIAEARRWISREVAAMGPNARVAIIAAGSEARVILPLSPSGPSVEEAVASLVATQDVANMEEALTLAEGLTGAAGSTRASVNAHIVILSDQKIDADVSRLSATTSTSALKPTVHLINHSSSDNVGITSLFTRTAPDARDDDEREAVIAIATSSASARRAHLVLSLGKHVIADRRVEIPEHGETTEHIAIRGGGRLVATIQSDDGKADAISLDDEASLVELARRAPRVALIRPAKKEGETEGAAAFFVERAIRAAGVTDLVILDPDDSPPSSVEVAVLLADGNARPNNVPTLLFGVEPGETGLKARAVGKTETHLRSVATEDALLRGVALDELTTIRAKVATPPRGARSLVDLDSGPTLIAGGSGTHAWVWLGIDPEASDLVLRVAFPVLIGNVLTHLGGASQVVTAKTVPRSEVTFATTASVDAVAAETKNPKTTALQLEAAPEPRWRLPSSPAMLIAMVGALLLALEAWLTFRRKWAT